MHIQYLSPHPSSIVSGQWRGIYQLKRCRFGNAASNPGEHGHSSSPDSGGAHYHAVFLSGSHRKSSAICTNLQSRYSQSVCQTSLEIEHDRLGVGVSKLNRVMDRKAFQGCWDHRPPSPKKTSLPEMSKHSANLSLEVTQSIHTREACFCALAC
jgi:hypothetical protein